MNKMKTPFSSLRRLLFFRLLPWMALVAVLCLSGCRSRKNTAPSGSGEYTPGSAAASGPSSPREMKDMFAAACAANDLWNRMRVPVTLRLTSPSSISVSGTAVLVRDESIFISLRMLGFEVAQIYVDNNRMIAVDKYHRKYFSGPLASLFPSSRVPAAVSDLQALLLGRPFVLGYSGADVHSASILRDFSFSSLGNRSGVAPGLWTAGVSDASSYDYGFVFGPDGVLVGFGCVLSAGKEMSAAYSGPFVRDGLTFASSVGIEAALGRTGKISKVSASVEWDFRRARWDDDVDPRTVSEPAGYSRVSASDLMKILGNVSGAM